MKCPKCSFVSHDYLDACRKCSIDLTDFKIQMNLRVVQPGAISLMAALEGAAVGLNTNAADAFSSQMLVQSDETLDDNSDNFDISLDDDFSAFDSDQLKHIRSMEPASAETGIDFDLSDASDTDHEEHDPALPPPTTGYATVMIDVSSMESLFGNDNTDSEATATAQDDEPSATPEEMSSDLLLDAADTIDPNTAMLDLEGLNEPTSTPDLDNINNADTTFPDIDNALDLDATIVDDTAVLDVPMFEDAASIEQDDAPAALEAEPISPSKDISLPHTVERTMVLGDLDTFNSPAPIDASDDVAAVDSFDSDADADTIVDTEIPDLDILDVDTPDMDMSDADVDTIVDTEIPDLDILDVDAPDMDMPEASEIEVSAPTTASFTPMEIDLEPDEASAANITAALEVPDTASAIDLDLSGLDFDLEPDLLHFESQETEDLEISFMSTEAPQPPMPQAHDADEMPLDLDDFDLEDDEQRST